jgi:large subunit ribosomal protein L10
MDRSQKEELVSQMRTRLCDSSAIVVVHQKGLTVDESYTLRKSMREAGAEFKVLKNTLAQIAIKGTELEGLTDMMSGPTALAFSADPMSAVKAIAKFAEKNDKIVLVGAYLNGQILDAKSVKAVSKLPSLDELRGTIIGIICAPATKLACIAKEPASMLARVISARGQG